MLCEDTTSIKRGMMLGKGILILKKKKKKS